MTKGNEEAQHERTNKTWQSPPHCSQMVTSHHTVSDVHNGTPPAARGKVLSQWEITQMTSHSYSARCITRATKREPSRLRPAVTLIINQNQCSQEKSHHQTIPNNWPNNGGKHMFACMNLASCFWMDDSVSTCAALGPTKVSFTCP